MRESISVKENIINRTRQGISQSMSPLNKLSEKEKVNIRRRRTRINFFLTFSMINGKSNSEMGTKSKNVTTKKFKDKIPGILEQNRKKI